MRKPQASHRHAPYAHIMAQMEVVTKYVNASMIKKNTRMLVCKGATMKSQNIISTFVKYTHPISCIMKTSFISELARFLCVCVSRVHTFHHLSLSQRPRGASAAAIYINSGASSPMEMFMSFCCIHGRRMLIFMQRIYLSSAIAANIQFIRANLAIQCLCRKLTHL